MKRLIIDELVKWKDSKHRKPLVLKGVRQVGKTWLLREFGRLHYDNVAYFNFDEQKDLAQLFAATKNVRRLLENLSMACAAPINAGKTLIIFDEIQECNDALNALKYFYENAPEFHVACAGSLLGIALSKPASFPVGKVEFLTVRPMTFTEFLYAGGDDDLARYMKNIDSIDPIPDLFFGRLREKLKMFFITGGMPEAVRAWAEDRDVQLVQSCLKNVLDAYELDFSKHAEIKDIAKLGLIWRSIPSQLSRENKKFLYSAAREGARAREYEDALTWLCNAGMVHKVPKVLKPGLPMSAYEDLTAFKLYCVDLGLLRRLSLLDPSAFNEGTRLFTEFKGALSENFILQGLVNLYETAPGYWASEAKAEVDFLIQRKNDIIPVEVKSDENVAGKSLALYAKKYEAETKIRIRFSLKNLKKDDDLLNVPLFMVDHLDKIIGLAIS